MSDLSEVNAIVTGSTRELALWTHPDRDLTVRHEPPWTDELLSATLQQLSAAPAMLNPDHIGGATREALRQHRSR